MHNGAETLLGGNTHTRVPRTNNDITFSLGRQNAGARTLNQRGQSELAPNSPIALPVLKQAIGNKVFRCIFHHLILTSVICQTLVTPYLHIGCADGNWSRLLMLGKMLRV